MLANVARCVMSAQATSVASEQLFSHTGNMTIRKRNWLGAVLLEHLVFNYANVTM